MRYAVQEPRSGRRPPRPYLTRPMAGILSLLFLAAVVAMFIRRSQRDTVVPVSRPPIERQNDNRPGHYYTVQPSDTLEDLAWRFYRDSSRWSFLARVNDIRDPRRLQVGELLWIPTGP